ncbi:hypothetical protein D3C78_1583460 [compost metagenome]
MDRLGRLARAGGRARTRRRAAQRALHLVEGVDVRLLPLRRFLAGEAHAQEGEAIAGEAVLRSPLALRVEIFNQRKIAGVELRRAVQLVDCANHIGVPLAEAGSDIEAGGGRLTVNQFDKDGS